MKFLAYPKISSSYKPSTSEAGGQHIAQEKIHGAQMVIGLHGNEFFFGKRKEWLAPQDNFFGWQLIQTELKDLSFKIYQALQLDSSSSLYIYGELFGGAYPHPDVEAIKGFSAVQTGVWYSPQLHWAPFDAVIRSQNGNLLFVNPLWLHKTVVDAGGISPRILASGNRAELLRLSVRFLTHVPKVLGLPEMESNWAEGYVVKPVKAMSPEKRFVSKFKIEEFDEKKFDESGTWSNDQILPLSDLKKIAQLMMNKARIESARSKVGPDDEKKLLAEVILDICLDLEEVYPETMTFLTPEEQEDLERFISSCFVF